MKSFFVKGFKGCSDIIPMIESIQKVIDRFKHKYFNFCNNQKALLLKLKGNKQLRKIFYYMYKGLISLICKVTS